jgi:hypothetical protein
MMDMSCDLCGYLPRTRKRSLLSSSSRRPGCANIHERGMLSACQSTRSRVEDRIFLCELGRPPTPIFKARPIVSWCLESRAGEMGRCRSLRWGRRLSVWIPKAGGQRLTSTSTQQVFGRVPYLYACWSQLIAKLTS